MMKFLSKAKREDIFGKTCLLRADLNIKSGDRGSSLRIKRLIPTINFLLKNNCKIILLSHRGRPKPINGPSLRSKIKILKDDSLFSVAKELSASLGKKVSFEEGLDLKEIKKRIDIFESGIFMLENLRFFLGEDKNDLKFAKNLSAFGDFYVNDAFAFSHRKNASMCAITKFLPSYFGLNLESEMKNLDKVIKNPKKPLVVILGGAKVSDKAGLINNLIKKADFILLGGGLANTFFALKNIPIGDSLCEKNYDIKPFEKLIGKKIILPSDVVISKKRILDIGSKTIEAYSSIIKKAKTIIWNGPMGMIEDKKFEKGSLGVLKAIISSGAFSVVGGGETTSFLIKKSLDKKISFLSTGGGAMLAYLSGKKLPALK